VPDYSCVWHDLSFSQIEFRLVSEASEATAEEENIGLKKTSDSLFL
jgi:hypothetical protein